jgi:hypothetical protein
MYCPFNDETAASMSETGVSCERVTSADAALRADGEGCDGPGGGGAGMMRIESIFSDVGASRSVIVGLVTFGGSGERRRVGFGCGAASESIDIIKRHDIVDGPTVHT